MHISVFQFYVTNLLLYVSVNLQIFLFLVILYPLFIIFYVFVIFLGDTAETDCITAFSIVAEIQRKI